MVSEPLGSTRLPLDAPPDWGEKVTLKASVFLGGSEMGKVSPLDAKPAPFRSDCTSTMFVLPELVSTTGTVPVDPTATLPNATVAGFEVSDTELAPVPPMLRTSPLFVALLVSVMVPPAERVAVGVKTTLKFADFPAARTSGIFNPDALN